MVNYIKAGRPAFMAMTALAAAIAFTAPAAAATARPAPASAQPVADTAQVVAVSPRACTITAQVDRDEHTGALFGVGFATCPVFAVQALMHVNFWIDNKVVRSRSLHCAHGTNCFTSSGSILPAAGRHRYCAEATFYVDGTDPSSQVWSCMFQG